MSALLEATNILKNYFFNDMMAKHNVISQMGLPNKNKGLGKNKGNVNKVCTLVNYNI